MVILNMLRDLCGDSSSPFGGWGNTPRTHWLESVASNFSSKLVDLARHKSEVTRCEELAEAVLSTEREARLLSLMRINIDTLLYSRRRLFNQVTLINTNHTQYRGGFSGSSGSNRLQTSRKLWTIFHLLWTIFHLLSIGSITAVRDRDDC